ncbi:MAG: 4-hydroxy-3-methylbut-2-enyl diphosphate reductase [Spirochaetia bacterium]|nr:4-hydroxy-3-methylbut-2-enyl diphosphate reductase [Spirochaetia bacterium]
MEIQKKIILASPRGFCAGVHRAIEAVERSIKLFGTPLYVHHQIVHNRHVVEDFIKKGVIFVESIEEVPDNVPVIFSAHGVSPEIRKKAAKKNLKIIDATCPLVTKVHNEAFRYAQDGYEILLIGHKNHVETIGTYGEAPDKIHIIEKIEDIENLDFSRDSKLAYLTQTTLSINDTKEMIKILMEKFPDIKSPGSSDICYATTNRQEAAEKIADKVDLVFVIGSQNSSNSNRLKELVKKLGKSTYLIDNADNIESKWIHSSIKVIGITAGASAPEELVKNTVDRLKNEFKFLEIEEMVIKEENIMFQLPLELLKSP